MEEEMFPPYRTVGTAAPPDSVPSSANHRYALIGQTKKHIVLKCLTTGVRFCATGRDEHNHCTVHTEQPRDGDVVFRQAGICSFVGQHRLFNVEGEEIRWSEVCSSAGAVRTRQNGGAA